VGALEAPERGEYFPIGLGLDHGHLGRFRPAPRLIGRVLTLLAPPIVTKPVEGEMSRSHSEPAGSRRVSLWVADVESEENVLGHVLGGAQVQQDSGRDPHHRGIFGLKHRLECD
jgi:hypothetical protein